MITRRKSHGYKRQQSSVELSYPLLKSKTLISLKAAFDVLVFEREGGLRRSAVVLGGRDDKSMPHFWRLAKR